VRSGAARDPTAATVEVEVRPAKLARVLRRGLRAAVTRSAACTIDARVMLDRKTAKGLEVAGLIARDGARIEQSGTAPITLKLRAAARKRLAGAAMRAALMRLARR
jgi:hypothetical protein